MNESKSISTIRWNKGWVAIPNRVIRDTSLTRQARLLWILLASFAGNDERTHPKTQDELLHWLKEGEEAPGRTTLYRWTKELIDNHWLIVHRTEHGNEYELLDGSGQCSTSETGNVPPVKHASNTIKTQNKPPSPPTPQIQENAWAGAWDRGEGEGDEELGEQTNHLTFDETTRLAGKGNTPQSSATPPNTISRDEFVSALQKLGVNYAAKLNIPPTRAALRKAEQMAKGGSQGGAIYKWLAEFGATLTDDTPAQANTDYQANFQKHLDNLKISYALRIEVHERTITLYFPTSYAAEALRESKHVLVQLVEKSVGFTPLMRWMVVDETPQGKSRFVRNQPRGAWGTGVGQ